MAGFIITAFNNGKLSVVVAPPGYYIESDTDQVVREKDGFRSPSPEWGDGPAYVFKSHRAAARVANLCPSATIQSLKGE